MGFFSVGCRVLNPATSKSTVVRRLMVDTSAESTWIDAAVLEAAEIEPRKKDLQPWGVRALNPRVMTSRRSLSNIGPLEPPPCAVADMQHLNPLLLF